MLPKIIIGRYKKDSELVDWTTIRTIEPKRAESLCYGKSKCGRYNSYENEANPIGRLKKLKEFLCENNEERPIEALICINKMSRDKENEGCVTSRQSHPLKEADNHAILSSEVASHNTSRQRMRLRELIPRSSRAEVLDE